MAIYKAFDINTVTTVKPWGAREEQAIKDIIDTLVVDTIDEEKNTSGHLHGKIYADDSISSIDSSTTDSVVITLKDNDSDGLIIKNRTGTSIIEVDSSTTTPKATFNYDADVVGKLYGDIYDLYDNPMIETRHEDSTIYFTSDKTASHDFNLDPATYTFRIHNDATELFRIDTPASNPEATFEIKVNVNDDCYIDGDFEVTGSLTYGSLAVSENLAMSSYFINYDGTDDHGVSFDASNNIILNDNVGIGIASPDGTCHIHTASAGSVTGHSNGNDLVVENSSHCGISVLSPDASYSQLFFGSPSAPVGAYLQWMYDDDLLRLSTANAGAEMSICSGNASEAIRIDSSGNVGIGIASPDGTCHIHTASAGTVTAPYTATTLVLENSGDTGMAILSPDSNYSKIVLGSPSNNLGVYLQWKYSDNLLKLSTANAGAEMSICSGNASEAIRIDSSGNVGIGETSPDTKLHVNSGSTDYVAHFESTDATACISFADSTTYASLGWVGIGATGDNLVFRSGGSQSMILNDSGYLGIGLTNPTEKLHIEGSSSPRINITDSGDSSQWEGGISSGNGAFLSMYDDSGNNNVIISSYGDSYFSGGRVGIGATPNYTFNVNSSTDNFVALFQSTDSFAGVYIRDNNTTADNNVGIGANGDNLVLIAENNVGINVTSPNELFHIYKDTAPAIEIENSSASLVLKVESSASLIDSEDLDLKLKAPSGSAVIVDTASFFGLPVKTDTGDPASPSEGYMYVNTYDNAVRLYADSTWRSIYTW